MAKNSQVFTSAKKGRQYNLGSNTLKIDPVFEADALYLGTDGRIHLHEVKNTARALRNKLKKNPEQLEKMLRWRKQDPDKREIRIVIATEAGWTEVFAARGKERAALLILKNKNVPLTIGEYNLSVAKMSRLLNATLKKIRTLRKQTGSLDFNHFYRQMPTLKDAESFRGTQGCRWSFPTMKNITLPKELLNLPHPWEITQPTRRREAIRSLSYEFNSIKTALNVLERSLQTFSQLTLENMDTIPEELIEHWEFSAEWLAEMIPTFEEFDLVKVEQFLIEEEGFESPSPNLIFSVGQYWVWWITWDIEDAALDWVQRALMKTREPILISRFLRIASRYWQKIEPRFAQSLLRRSATIGWQKALPLLERVEQHPNASEAVKKTVRNYREFVLDNPEKWRPDSDANEERLPEVEELPNKRPLFLRPQPAFGQLAIAHGVG